jgi:hypothetical protein
MKFKSSAQRKAVMAKYRVLVRCPNMKSSKIVASGLSKADAEIKAHKIKQNTIIAVTNGKKIRYF